MSDDKPEEVNVWSQIYGPVDPTKSEGGGESVGSSSERESSGVAIIRGRDAAKERTSKGSSRGMGGETSPFAMDNRDPNNLNPHIQILWDDIIGEAEGLRTPDKCWDCSQSCYNGTRRCCYVFLVVLFAPFIAFCNGCQFACLAFNQVWCVGPCLRCYKINCATFKKFWEGCLYACIGPCMEALGMLFSRITVRYQKVPDGNSQDNSSYFNV